jgi:transcriptional regulator with XRE-family HTH domain
MAQTHVPVAATLTKRVSAGLRAELGRQEKHQGHLAEILGIDRAQISKRLKGESLSFTTAELDKIAAAWGVPVDRLIDPSVLAGAA